MSKVICQNCHEILADRNIEKGEFRYDPCGMDSVVQTIEHTVLLTLSCPKCGCMVQVIV